MGGMVRWRMKTWRGREGWVAHQKEYLLLSDAAGSTSLFICAILSASIYIYIYRCTLGGYV